VNKSLSIVWFLILIVPFLFYHNNKPVGPDSGVYLEVAHNIVSKGSLNILPEVLFDDTPYQITKTNHAPIHQNIGGVLFILPATLLAVATQHCATLIPDLSPRFYLLGYHEGMWLGCITYLMAMLSCVMIYRVACRYHQASAVITALLSCAFGGPLLIYTSAYPCQTNLPAAFLSSLLIYMYHFADLKKSMSWLLMGAVWGVGTFVRTEFAVWGVLLIHALIQQSPLPGEWRTLLRRALLAGGGGLLFIIPSMMIRQILFGESGSTYLFQFDYTIFSRSYLMLWGARNGLFVFWPIFVLSIIGYFWKIGRNPPLYHVLFAIVVLETMLLGSTVFWSGEFGASFGQRRFLVVFPCLVLCLARFLDSFRKYFYWLVPVCIICVIWANLVYAAYGLRWTFPDSMTGFLLTNQFSGIFSVVGNYYPLFVAEALSFLFVPKHADVYWLFPAFAMVASLVWLFYRRLDRQRIFNHVLIAVVSVACVTTVFLAGAEKRGEQVFREIESNNRHSGFIQRNYEIDFEIIGSSVDIVAFFLELHDDRTAQYHMDRTVAFLNREAPDQVMKFKQMCDALLLRSSLGWSRLVPEQSHDALLDWYYAAHADIQQKRSPLDVLALFLY